MQQSSTRVTLFDTYRGYFHHVLFSVEPLVERIQYDQETQAEKDARRNGAKGLAAKDCHTTFEIMVHAHIKSLQFSQIEISKYTEKDNSSSVIQ